MYAICSGALSGVFSVLLLLSSVALASPASEAPSQDIEPQELERQASESRDGAETPDGAVPELLPGTFWSCVDDRTNEPARLALLDSTFAIELPGDERLWGTISYEDGGEDIELMGFPELGITLVASYADGEVRLQAGGFHARCGAQIEAFLSADQAPALYEIWVADMTCIWGEMRATIRIPPVWHGGFSLGEVALMHVATGDTAIYKVMATYFPDRNDVDIADGPVIQEAENFIPIGFTGHLSEDGETIYVDTFGASKCFDVELRRQ